MDNGQLIVQRLSDDGFVGPFDTELPAALIAAVAERVKAITHIRDPHPLYGRYSVRDWHLVEPEFLTLFTAQPILDVLTPVLGDDIVLWRSKIFLKEPGEGELGWHQEWGAFNGEEIGNDRPALVPAQQNIAKPWNYTVWIALEDVTVEMGPLRFAKGSNKKRYPIAMQKLTDSEFYVDPFAYVADKQHLIRLVNSSSLVLDIDTSGYFAGIETATLSLDALKDIVLTKLDNEYGAVTLEFDPAAYEVRPMLMKAGQFVVFTERCMHGSAANSSTKQRIGINARYTNSSTEIYPFKTSACPVDGSNIDISQHQAVLVKGQSLCDRNRLVTDKELKTTLAITY